MPWLQWLKCKVVRAMQVLCMRVMWVLGLRPPRHVAVIMDGNRRFARQQNMDITLGHRKGFDKLMQISKMCSCIGVKELTVYAFSIENFKRSRHEVDELLALAAEKFQKMIDNVHQMDKWGVSVKVVGRLGLLPPPLQTLAAKVFFATNHNTQLRLNIAFPYTGRDEISRAASHIVDGVKNQDLSVEDIDEDLILQALDVGEPGLLVRTSGEVRLSDYMLWQVSNTVLYFTDVLWPNMNIFHLLAACVHYKKHAHALSNKTESTKFCSVTKKQFLEKLDKAKWRELERLANF